MKPTTAPRGYELVSYWEEFLRMFSPVGPSQEEIGKELLIDGRIYKRRKDCDEWQICLTCKTTIHEGWHPLFGEHLGLLNDDGRPHTCQPPQDLAREICDDWDA